MEHPTALKQIWLDRLGGGGDVDLRADPEPVRELVDAWTPPGFQLHVLEGSWMRVEAGEPLRVEFTAALEHYEDGAAGVVQRRVDGVVVEHVKLELPEPHQGKGVGRTMLGASALVYEDLGLEQISLIAVDRGRYVWAAAGFSFAHDGDRADVLNAVEGICDEAGLSLDHLDRDAFEPWDLAYLDGTDDLTYRDVVSSYDPALIDEDPHADEWDEPLARAGKLLLLLDDVPGWRGVMDLRDLDENIGRSLMYEFTSDHGHAD